MLELLNIEKSFGSYPVFTIDKLCLLPGIYWLKGANGSGKSTFLNMLAGLIPFKGSVVLDQQFSIHQQAAAYRMLVNHSEAEPVYPSFLSGNDLVKFVVSVKKGTKQQVEEIREALLMDHYLANPAGSYSSGMLKKLSLLLAFIGGPKWILLDEPFTTLDQASQKALQQLISAQHQKGVSFIITSHHDMKASAISFDKAFLLDQKRLVEITG
jgi:ABC-2 type transport system ATP-binding protein